MDAAKTTTQNLTPRWASLYRRMKAKYQEQHDEMKKTVDAELAQYGYVWVFRWRMMGMCEWEIKKALMDPVLAHLEKLKDGKETRESVRAWVEEYRKDLSEGLLSEQPWRHNCTCPTDNVVNLADASARAESSLTRCRSARPAVSMAWGRGSTHRRSWRAICLRARRSRSGRIGRPLSWIRCIPEGPAASTLTTSASASAAASASASNSRGRVSKSR